MTAVSEITPAIPPDFTSLKNRRGEIVRLPRISIRWLMALVLGAGLALGLVLPAREVLGSKKTHPHGFLEKRSDGIWMTAVDNVESPFWPRYRLKLLGRPWQNVPDCLVGKSRRCEVCRKENPRDFLYYCIGGHWEFWSIDIAREILTLNGLPPDPRLEALARGN
jgi:hypothetical protein